MPPPVYPPPYPGAAGYPGYPGYPSYPGAAGYYPGAAGYYPGAYDPYRPIKPPGTNGMAIAALAVSLGSLVLFCGMPSIVAVILGVIAMSQTRRTGQEGFGLALAGTIIGAVPHRALAALPAAVHRRRMAVGAVAGRGCKEAKGV